MEVYCQRQGKSFDSTRFLYDGQRLHPDSTAEEMDMEDNTIIDAGTKDSPLSWRFCIHAKQKSFLSLVLHQVGGGSC